MKKKCYSIVTFLILFLYTNLLLGQCQCDGNDLILPYGAEIKTIGMDANSILRTSWSPDFGGDHLSFFVPGNNQPQAHRLIVSETGDLYVKYGFSIKTWGMDANNLITTGWAQDIGDYVKFWVPGNDPIENTSKLVIAENGNVGIGLHPRSKLHVNGTTTTSVLTITGGSDIAEPFAISESDTNKILPGSVVVIDELNPGKLILSQFENDKKAVGVISGANGVNPGLVLSQANTFEHGENIAISGRVYVRANNSNGNIEPGDFLTTSNVLGEAMKVTDISKSQGAIIGKAMTTLDKSNGYVLLFISLQ